MATCAFIDNGTHCQHEATHYVMRAWNEDTWHVENQPRTYAGSLQHWPEFCQECAEQVCMLRNAPYAVEA